MYKFVMFLIVLTWGLVACSPAGGQAAESTSLATLATQGVSRATTSPAAADATSTPSAEDGTAVAADTFSGMVLYAIVPEESTVTYEVGETFLDQGNVFKVAVGETQGVTGEIRVNFDQPQDTTLSAFTVDIIRFTSDDQRRDGAIRDRFLQSAQYPTVSFIPTAIEGLPETIEPGLEYPITLLGDLTIRDTTRPAAFEARVSLEGNTLTGQAVTTFLMSDYGFGPINVLGILRTEDEVKITIDFVARP